MHVSGNSVCQSYITLLYISNLNYIVIQSKLLILFIQGALFYRYDFNTSEKKVLGFHTAPIKCVEFCPELGMSLFNCKFILYCFIYSRFSNFGWLLNHIFLFM